MTKENQNKLGAHAVMFAVMKKRPEIVALLVQNGIPASISDTDMQLSNKITNVMRASDAFKKDFVDMLSKEDVAEACFSAYSMNGYSNAVGDPTKNPFAGLFDSSLNTLPSGGTIQTTAAPTTGTTPPKSSWFNATNITNTLNTALNAFLTLDKNKTDRELANAGVKIAQSNASSGVGSGAIGWAPQTSSKTPIYVAVGVVVAAVIVAGVYYATKKGK